MILHNGTKIKSGINLSSLIGILTGPVDLFSKYLIILSKFHEIHEQLKIQIDFFVS